MAATCAVAALATSPLVLIGPVSAEHCFTTPTAIGRFRRRWLTSYQILLAVRLLAIPYVTRAYEFTMQSQGRFAAVVFPVYIVLGQLLARLPTAVAVALLALSGFLMAAYAALFATGHALI